MRAKYAVRHHYRYTYTGRVTDLKQHLVMVPRDTHRGQRLLEHAMDVRGADAFDVRWSFDAYGNRVCDVDVTAVAQAIDFEATYTVEREVEDARASEPWPDDLMRPAHYLQPTALTAPDDRLRAIAEHLAVGARTLAVRAERAHDWAAEALTYQFGVTGVHTPAAMALHVGRGVCQDYAHIMLSVLRLLGVPCRYISGHLLGEGAPHAWVEAFVEDERSPDRFQLIAYDPTHHRRAGMSYITVAYGRDYRDVTPTSGTFSGAATGKLSASKHATIVELEHAPELMSA